MLISVKIAGMCGCICTPCQMADNAARLNESPGLYCILSVFLPCIPILMLRKKMRQRYGIEGTAHKDAVSAWCCPMCTSCQLANELDNREVSLPEEANFPY